MRFLKRIGDIVKNRNKSMPAEKTNEPFKQANTKNQVLNLRQPTNIDELQDSKSLATQERLERMKTLTLREWEVYEHLIRGLKMREIAELIGVTYPTVNFHCRGLYKKLCINTRAQLFMQYSTLDTVMIKRVRERKT